MCAHVLATFQVGQRVQLLCVRVRTRVVLFKIRPLETPSDREENAEVKRRGLISR